MPNKTPPDDPETEQTTNVPDAWIDESPDKKQETAEQTMNTEMSASGVFTNIRLSAPSKHIPVPPPLPRHPEVVILAPEMFDHLNNERYLEAVRYAEKILEYEPEHVDALQCAAICYGELHKQVLEKLGPLGRKAGQRTLPPPSSEVDPLEHLANRMFDRLAAGNYAAALMAAEELLQKDPSSTDALQCAELARSELRKMYAKRLGTLQGIPKKAQLKLDTDDATCKAVWKLIDGKRTIQELIDIAAVSALDLLRALYEMRNEGSLRL